jgi:hypothetical protein
MQIIIFILVVLLISCSNAENDKRITEPEEVIYGYPDTLLAWEVNPDSMRMKRVTIFPDSSITVNRIINGLNDKYPNVHIELLKQSVDTLYINIPNSDYLGEQMGSAGSSAWFADATINLTSVPGVNYVSYKMDLHSHAESNVLGRDAYRNWKKE